MLQTIREAFLLIKKEKRGAPVFRARFYFIADRRSVIDVLMYIYIYICRNYNINGVIQSKPIFPI